MIIGTCSLCGGPVESPDRWGGILPPPIRCLHCGAEKPKHGPVIDMHRPKESGVRMGAVYPMLDVAETPTDPCRYLPFGAPR